ncbi:MAG TPA: nitroreductase family protein [Arachidicoccus sp.]
MNDTAIDFLKSRVSIRDFDPDAVVTAAEIEQILTIAGSAPSGNNSQPWKVAVVQNKDMQAEIYTRAYQQLQVKNAAGVFLVFGDRSAYEIDHLVAEKLKNGTLAPAGEGMFRKKIDFFYASSPAENSVEAIMLDCGLFAMNLLYAIKAFGYDAVPMRGADFDAIKKYLELSESWQPVLMIPFGKARTAGNEKIRKKPAEFSLLFK